MDIENIIKDKKLFKEWFIDTYIKEFREVPIFKTFDIKKIKKIEKEKEKEEIEKYLKKVIEIVSLTLFNEDLTLRVLEKGRHLDTNLVRQVSLYIMCDMLKFSKTITGEMINKDRTTVIHHCKTISGLLQVDKAFRVKFERVLTKIDESGLAIFGYKNEEAKIYRNN